MSLAYDAQTDNYEITVNVKNVSGMEGRNSVQLFLQKPYTDYDRQNGIEKAAVELVDFAKTQKLAVDGEGETVKFTVARRELASYDSYGEKTYVLENGTYYFAVGTDAHDAVNNVLAAKHANGMTDVKGNAVTGNAARKPTTSTRRIRPLQTVRK